MQIISELENGKMDSEDLLNLACHPISKLKFVSTVICSDSGNTDGRFLECFNSDNVYAIGEIVRCAAEELFFITDKALDQCRNDALRREHLEKVLENFISFLEDPGPKPDLKTMAARIRKEVQP